MFKHELSLSVFIRLLGGTGGEQVRMEWKHLLEGKGKNETEWVGVGWCYKYDIFSSAASS